MVAAARTEVGVTALAAVAFFMDSALAPWLVTEESSFISSYWRVVYWSLILLYSMASNQEFHWPTATNSATVAYTGLHSGETNLMKIVM